ncbi:hypothetical protein A6A28_25635 [Streptomyces sp. CB03578]|uniref:DUF7691 family protein n=1 Tax=Streptomyces sp. CB03578 TaxID=1718987 RepID=UPI00093C45D6|nr:hypothetical protein [Streptomyces sp. CB03578]OKI41944.1 hypothetical protein A6A28_25635 [Streptomyces sp. CB03578]
MSKVVNYSMANRGEIARFLPALDLSADESRRLDNMRVRAKARQDSLDHQDVDWGLSVPDALEELISGRADSPADYAGCAYYAALQIIIDHNASDSSTLASYRSPVTYFSALDDVLSSAGVPADLLPYQYVFSGPPSEIGFRIPHPLEGSPEIGCWPLAKAGPAVAAYRAVLDRVDADLRYDLGELIEALDGWASEWNEGEGAWWWAEDGSIFFSITG